MLWLDNLLPASQVASTRTTYRMKSLSFTPAILAIGLSSAIAGSGPAPSPSGKGPVPAAPSDPCAGPISYSSVELLYANTDAGGPDELDGGSLRVEFSAWSHFYLAGSVNYTDLNYDEGWRLSGGVGVYYPVTNNVHLALDAGIFHTDTSYAIGAIVARRREETGWYARPHVRAKLSCFEVQAGAQYVDLDEYNDWNWFAQLYYQVAPRWDITAGFNEWDDDEAETWTVGARFGF